MGGQGRHVRADVRTPLFLAGHAPTAGIGAPSSLAWVSVIPALAFGWYAAVTYVPLARAALAEGRRQREEAST